MIQPTYNLLNELFENLSDEAFVREKFLIDKKIVPFSPATLWRKCKKREFPQPIKISAQITAWKVKDIRAWAKNPQSYKCDGGNQ
jgi:prophage regulatory protein